MRWAMEKVWECGLMWLRDEMVELHKTRIEDQIVMPLMVFGRTTTSRRCSMAADLSNEDTRRRGPATARPLKVTLEFALRGIGEAFCRESPLDLCRGQSREQGHRGMTDGAEPPGVR